MFRYTHVSQQRAGKTPPHLYQPMPEPEPIATEPETPPRTLAEILAEVADEFGVTITALLSARRERPLPAIRAEFCWRAYETERYSTTQIGRAINRDHTTVLFAIGKLARQRPSEATEAFLREHAKAV
jgi:chromosomal replication initiation ATPase DnaA